jgi:hypothetical protein
MARLHVRPRVCLPTLTGERVSQASGRFQVHLVVPLSAKNMKLVVVLPLEHSKLSHGGQAVMVALFGWNVKNSVQPIRDRELSAADRAPCGMRLLGMPNALLLKGQ